MLTYIKSFLVSSKTEESVIVLEQFSLYKMKKNPVICSIGLKATGKTTLSRDLLQHLSSLLIPSSYKFHVFSRYEIPSLPKEYTSYKNTLEVSDITKIANQSSTSLVLVTNNVDNPKYKNDFLINYCSCDELRAKASIIIEIQTVFEIRLSIRKQIDYYFIFNHTLARIRQQIYSFVKIDNLSFEDFNKLIDTYTQDYSTLVVDVKNNKLYWYKVDVKQNNLIDVPDLKLSGKNSFCVMLSTEKALFTLKGIRDSDQSWKLYQEYIGDTNGIMFIISDVDKLQYFSPNPIVMKLTFLHI